MNYILIMKHIQGGGSFEDVIKWAIENSGSTYYGPIFSSKPFNIYYLESDGYVNVNYYNTYASTSGLTTKWVGNATVDR